MSAKISSSPFKLDLVLLKLLEKEPFYSTAVQSCRIIYDHPKIPTAASSFMNFTPLLFFNREFMSSITLEEQVAVLKHEILHLIFSHTENFRAKYEYPDLWNYATDCLINQYIGESRLPRKRIVDGKSVGFEPITLELLSTQLNLKLEPLQSAEYYYEAMIKSAKKISGAGSGTGTVDEHLTEEDLKEIAKAIGEGDVVATNEQLKTAARVLVDKAIKGSAGNVPFALSKAFKHLFKDSGISWKSLLRNFVASATSSKRKATRKKSNRRFGFNVPGTKKHRELKVAYCMDTSGSVSEEQFHAGVNEMLYMFKSKMISELHVIYADCKVQKVIKVTTEKKIPFERHGKGGTAYQPAISKARELGVDAIIYFGDMDTADTPSNPGIPVMWLTVGSTKKPGNFGSMVELKVS